MSSVVVRNAREDEVEAAAEVLNEHSRRLYGPPTPLPRSCAKTGRHRGGLPDNVLVAELEGRLVGYADVIHAVRRRGSMFEAPTPGRTTRCSRRSPGADTLGRDNVRGWAPEIDRDLQEAYRAGFRPFGIRSGWRSSSTGTYRSPMARRLRPSLP